MLRISLHRLNPLAPRLSCSPAKVLGTPAATRNKLSNHINTSAWSYQSSSLLDKSGDSIDYSFDNKNMTINARNNESNKTNLIMAGQRRHAGTSAGKYAPAPSVRATVPFEHNRNNSDSTMSASRLENNNSPESHNDNNYGHSDELPKLPVADLEQTMEKLKESLAPFAMNSHEYAETLNLIDEFQASPGVKLSLLLNEKAKQTNNWMSHDWWQHETYLSSRSSLMINSNPAMM